MLGALARLGRRPGGFLGFWQVGEKPAQVRAGLGPCGLIDALVEFCLVQPPVGVVPGQPVNDLGAL